MFRTRSLLIVAGAIAGMAAGLSAAEIRVVASTTDLAEFVRAVGGNHVSVDYIVRGNQNPHVVEVKPSYMMKLKSADLFFIVGMQLEIWGPQIVDGSRNDHLRVVDCSRGIERMEVPAGKVDASQGDVHPLGNPHYLLDPENVKVVLREIVDALAGVAPSLRGEFQANADAYRSALEKRIAGWVAVLAPYRGRKFVTYHTSFSYFAKRFGLEVAGYVEPKPGIAPTPSHVVELTSLMRREHVGVVGVEQYFEESTPQSIADQADARLVRLCTSSGGREGLDSYAAMIDSNVRQLAAAFAAEGK